MVPASFVSAEVRTPARVAVVNVTPEVRRALTEAGLRDGLALVSVPHTTCALCVNEDEAGLREDLVRLAGSLVAGIEPAGGFAHDRIDNNARAHLFAALAGSSVAVPVRGGGLALGTWQSVLLIEADGPRARRLEMTFLGS
jgi:secondary thiamine-phosphate synthase enzyme